MATDRTDSQGRCIGRHPGQAPEIDSICYLTEPAPPGTLVPVEVVGWRDDDLIVRPQ